jgi:hypothetical protein
MNMTWNERTSKVFKWLQKGCPLLLEHCQRRALSLWSWCPLNDYCRPLNINSIQTEIARFSVSGLGRINEFDTKNCIRKECQKRNNEQRTHFLDCKE